MISNPKFDSDSENDRFAEVLLQFFLKEVSRKLDKNHSERAECQRYSLPS